MANNMRRILVIKNIPPGNYRLQRVIIYRFKKLYNPTPSCDTNFSSVDSYTPNTDYDYSEKPKVYCTQLKCFKCCESFDGFSELSNHLAVDHAKKLKSSIECVICDEKFQSKNELQKHMVRKHKTKPLFRPWV